MCVKLKEEFTLEKMLQGRVKNLKQLFKMIFSLKFDEEPDYNTMKQILIDLRDKQIMKYKEKNEDKLNNLDDLDIK